MIHLVKVGLMGAVGRFQSVDHTAYPRDTEVVCRTARGLEIATVMCPLADDTHEPDGDLLRRVGQEDRLVIERLERFRDRAFNACQQKLIEMGVHATLVDVEHLFDGQSVYFYFLGDQVDGQIEALTSELAETYEAKIRFRKFSEALANGCGPGCGTTASKCGTSEGCASCALRCKK